LQEQVNRETIAITVKASKLTAKVLAKLLATLVRKIQKEHQKAQTPQGKQSVKKLMNHNVPTNTIEISGDKGLFDRIARKWNVDYAFYKTGPDKHLLLFKSGQADAITAAFSEYSKRVMKRAKDKRPPIMEQLRRAAERAKQERHKHKERKREREVSWDER
jgi:hypothetical protein